MTTNNPEVVAYATHHDEPMLFSNKREAAMYCDDGEEPLALIHISDYAALEAECERLRQSMLHLVTMYCTVAMKNNATDAELEQYLSAGIAQLEAERDALADKLTTTDRQWIPVSERLPEPNKKVLATYTNRLGNTRRVIAEFVAKHTVEDSDDRFGDDADYDKAEDQYYCPAGWYECVENLDDPAYISITEGEITHWMPLPRAPEGELK